MARSRPPSFDFYPEDFLAGTMHLHPTCIGIYIRLLCFQWSHGAVSLDDKRQLMQITGAMPDELDEHLPQVRDKFDRYEDGLYRNARLEREREHKEKVSARRKDAINKRWEKEKDTQTDTNVSTNVHTNEDTKGIPPTRKLEVGSKEVKKEKRNAVDKLGEWILPERFDTPEIRQLLAEFEAMRIEKHAPIKSRPNTSKVFKHFDDVEHLAYAIEFCIANGYQGLKPDYRKPPAGRPVQKTFADMRVDRTRQAIEDFAHG